MQATIDRAALVAALKRLKTAGAVAGASWHDAFALESGEQGLTARRWIQGTGGALGHPDVWIGLKIPGMSPERGRVILPLRATQGALTRLSGKTVELIVHDLNNSATWTAGNASATLPECPFESFLYAEPPIDSEFSWPHAWRGKAAGFLGAVRRVLHAVSVDGESRYQLHAARLDPERGVLEATDGHRAAVAAVEGGDFLSPGVDASIPRLVLAQAAKLVRDNDHVFLGWCPPGSEAAAGIFGADGVQIHFKLSQQGFPDVSRVMHPCESPGYWRVILDGPALVGALKAASGFTRERGPFSGVHLTVNPEAGALVVEARGDGAYHEKVPAEIFADEKTGPPRIFLSSILLSQGVEPLGQRVELRLGGAISPVGYSAEGEWPMGGVLMPMRD